MAYYPTYYCGHPVISQPALGNMPINVFVTSTPSSPPSHLVSSPAHQLHPFATYRGGQSGLPDSSIDEEERAVYDRLQAIRRYRQELEATRARETALRVQVEAEWRAKINERVIARELAYRQILEARIREANKRRANYAKIVEKRVAELRASKEAQRQHAMRHLSRYNYYTNSKASGERVLHEIDSLPGAIFGVRFSPEIEFESEEHDQCCHRPFTMPSKTPIVRGQPIRLMAESRTGKNSLQKTPCPDITRPKPRSASVSVALPLPVHKNLKVNLDRFCDGRQQISEPVKSTACPCKHQTYDQTSNAQVRANVSSTSSPSQPTLQLGDSKIFIANLINQYLDPSSSCREVSSHATDAENDVEQDLSKFLLDLGLQVASKKVSESNASLESNIMRESIFDTSKDLPSQNSSISTKTQLEPKTVTTQKVSVDEEKSAPASPSASSNDSQPVAFLGNFNDLLGHCLGLRLEKLPSDTSASSSLEQTSNKKVPEGLNEFLSQFGLVFELDDSPKEQKLDVKKPKPTEYSSLETDTESVIDESRLLQSLLDTNFINLQTMADKFGCDDACVDVCDSKQQHQQVKSCNQSRANLDKGKGVASGEKIPTTKNFVYEKSSELEKSDKKPQGDPMTSAYAANPIVALDNIALKERQSRGEESEPEDERAWGGSESKTGDSRRTDEQEVKPFSEEDLKMKQETSDTPRITKNHDEVLKTEKTQEATMTNKNKEELTQDSQVIDSKEPTGPSPIVSHHLTYAEIVHHVLGNETSHSVPPTEDKQQVSYTDHKETIPEAQTENFIGEHQLDTHSKQVPQSTYQQFHHVTVEEVDDEEEKGYEIV
ncbi:uncharacterized protein L203_102489 [Cryptococcus depauperatus CBS 7841]|uniref:Uncharacterized protein n=1 Tax=Cryptococcus depauperatus CBS 7841 TaxID=1295531 RepID=A0AAJ8JS20_9TREE